MIAFSAKKLIIPLRRLPASAGTVKVSEPRLRQEIKYRLLHRVYHCIEHVHCLNKEEKEYKSYLESIGDSIVVVADDEIVKTHVHTNDPGLAIQKALTHGSLYQDQDRQYA